MLIVIVENAAMTSKTNRIIYSVRNPITITTKRKKKDCSNTISLSCVLGLLCWSGSAWLFFFIGLSPLTRRSRTPPHFAYAPLKNPGKSVLRMIKRVNTVMMIVVVHAITLKTRPLVYFPINRRLLHKRIINTKITGKSIPPTTLGRFKKKTSRSVGTNRVVPAPTIIIPVYNERNAGASWKVRPTPRSQPKASATE